MKYLFAIVVIAFLTAFKQPAGGALTVNSADFNNAKGSAVLFLFRKTDKIPGNPFITLRTPIQNNRAEFIFQNLPYGEYAAILLHDENDNGKIDHSFGLPAEQLGYSNNWELGFFTGMPNFSKLKFAFSATWQTQNINISYRKNKKQ